MEFKEFFTLIWAFTVFAAVAYLLFGQRLSPFGAAVVVGAAAFFLVVVLNIDTISSLGASWGSQASFRVEMNRLKEDVFAKAETVKRVGEELARFSAHNIATAGRWGSGANLEQMLQERERIRALLNSLGSDQAHIDETLVEINKYALFDLKGNVVSAVGKIHKFPQKEYEQFLLKLRSMLDKYNGPASRPELAGFLQEHQVYDRSIEAELERLDLFITQGHI